MADTSTPTCPAPVRRSPSRRPTTPTPGATSGVFGGRYVPEALMAVIEEVTAAYEKARTDQTFLDELDRLQTHYAGRPSPLYEASRLSEHAGGAHLPQARGPEPHRIAQDQQRARSGPAGQADGQDRVIAETGRVSTGGHRHRVRAAGPGVRHLHGRGRHRPPGAQRGQDATAGRRGGVGAVRAPRPSRTRSTTPSATGSPTPTAPTTASEPRPDRTRSRSWSAISSASSDWRPAPRCWPRPVGCPTR